MVSLTTTRTISAEGWATLFVSFMATPTKFAFGNKTSCVSSGLPWAALLSNIMGHEVMLIILASLFFAEAVVVSVALHKSMHLDNESFGSCSSLRRISLL